jgi:hypothetical protein
MTGRIEHPTITVRRKDLLPRELSDEELLADAAREAERWQAQLRKRNRRGR